MTVLPTSPSRSRIPARRNDSSDSVPQFEHLAEVDVEGLGDQPDGLLHQFVGVGMGEGPKAQLRHDGLLAFPDLIAMDRRPTFGDIVEGDDNPRDPFVFGAVGKHPAMKPATVGGHHLAIDGLELFEDHQGFLVERGVGQFSRGLRQPSVDVDRSDLQQPLRRRGEPLNSQVKVEEDGGQVRAGEEVHLVVIGGAEADPSSP